MHYEFWYIESFPWKAWWWLNRVETCCHKNILCNKLLCLTETYILYESFYLLYSGYNLYLHLIKKVGTLMFTTFGMTLWAWAKIFYWLSYIVRKCRVCYVNVHVRRTCLPVWCLNLLPPDGATARGGPWPPLQCASKPLNSLLCLSIHLNPSSSGPWTCHPATSFLVFLFVLLHTAFRTTSFMELRCLAFFLCDLATVFFGI